MLVQVPIVYNMEDRGQDKVVYMLLTIFFFFFVEKGCALLDLSMCKL